MSTARPNVEQLAEDARQLRDLLIDPERWITGNLAKRGRESNLVLSPTSDAANCFCLLGGIARVYGIGRTPTRGDNTISHDAAATPLGRLVGRVIQGMEPSQQWRADRGDTERGAYNHAVIWIFNDSKSHAEVIEALETVVAMAEGAAAAGVEV